MKNDMGPLAFEKYRFPCVQHTAQAQNGSFCLENEDNHKILNTDICKTLNIKATTEEGLDLGQKEAYPLESRVPLNKIS